MKCNFYTKLQLPPEPLTRGLPLPDPRSVCPLSSTEFVETPQTKFMGTPLDRTIQLLSCFLRLENFDHLFDTKCERGCVLPSFGVIVAGSDVAVYRAPLKEPSRVYVYINKTYKS